MDTNQRPRAAGAALTLSMLAGVGLLAGCTSGGSSTALPSTSAPTRPAGTAAAPTAVASSPGALSPSASPGGLSPSAFLHAAQAAVRSGGSVHVDITDSSASGSIHFSDDDTASGGRQVVTLSNGGRVTILLIDGTDYVQANAAALEGFFQVPPAQAEQNADQWIKLSAGEKIGTSTYDDVTAGITLSSVADELALAGTLKPAKPSTVDGQPVTGVEAPMPASAKLPASARNVLYATDNSLHRPVVLEVLDAGSYKYLMSFSQWGEAVHLTAPANSIPASDTASGPSLT